ncbi:MAG: cytochrome c oxidase accessory protein CcoG, partial [Cytophagaceae bacterium]
VFTVIYGRVFCGWVCPQTIFMEHVFRRIEYFIEGDYKKQIALDKASWTREKLVRKSAKHFVFFTISFLISNIFLAYIIGSEALFEIINEPISQHLGGISTILVFSGVFYWVYARFREQVCTVVCPYGRLQGVLLDRNSVVVAYDYVRGEPRVKYRKGEDRSLRQKGSCIDCNLCVDVCPTGIDIRNGTQLECISCTACIDACDFVMTKTNQPKGLIRHDSEEGIASQKKFRFTKRMTADTGVLVILLVALVFLLFTRTLTSTTILRTPGLMYQQQEDGSISNLYNYKIINKSNKNLSLEFRPLNFEGTIKKVGNGGLNLEKQALGNGALFIIMDQQDIQEMKTRLQVGVYSEGKLLETVKTTFIAPVQ